MKKTFISFLALMGAAGAWAQSTCETRVDAHQKATTNQRVNYCLNPDYGAQGPQGPQLILSTTDSYTVPQPAPARQVRPTAEKGVFEEADVEVTHSFVQTRQFPKWTDGRESEQYKREYREAMTSGPATAQEAISQTECEPEEDVVPVETTPKKAARKKATKSKAKKGSKAKPARRVAAAAPAGEAPVTSGLENIEEVADLSSQYTYEDSYAPATSRTQTSSKTDEYVPAGIADLPSETSDEIAAGAYSYAPATSSTTTTTTKTTTTTTKTSSKSTTVSSAASDDEIAVGAYSYAPASYGSTSTSTKEVLITKTPEAPIVPEVPESKDIPVGEYSYAPASYGSTSTSTQTVTTVTETTPKAPAKESEDIPVGEYSYAPAQ